MVALSSQKITTVNMVKQITYLFFYFYLDIGTLIEKRFAVCVTSDSGWNNLVICFLNSALTSSSGVLSSEPGS